MATQTTETSERDDTERSTTTDGPESDGSRISALPSTAIAQVKNGRLPMLVGGVMAARGIRGLLSERSGGMTQTAAGLVLLGLGLRQRSKRGSGMTEIGIDFGSDEERTDESVPGRETVSRRSESNVPDHNPRDVDQDPEVEGTEDQDEGDVRYETEREDVDVERKPHLEEVDPKDPRYPDEGDPETDDGHVDVDISESALADEPNEAVGPDEEQAYPASEGTDPEPSAPKSPERAGESADDETSSDVGEDEDESTADEGSTGDDSDDEDIEESV